MQFKLLVIKWPACLHTKLKNLHVLRLAFARALGLGFGFGEALEMALSANSRASAQGTPLAQETAAASRTIARFAFSV